MTDQPVALPALDVLASEVSIPQAFAAKSRRKVAKVASDVAAPTTPTPPVIADAPAPASVYPTAAASAAPSNKEPTMATTIENVTQTTTDKTQAHFADMNARATDAMAKSTKLFGEMNSFAKDNVEAMVESGKVAAKGLETLAQDGAQYVRKQFEDATAAARTMAAVKSPTEFVKLHGDFVRQQFDAMVAQGSRSTETMLKLAGEVVQPMANRVAVAVEKIKHAA